MRWNPPHRNRLGAFGNNPPPTANQLKTVKNAVNYVTNQFYQQDTRCPEGQKMYPSGCNIDADYMPLPEPPEGGFLSCEEWDLFGYPAGHCNKENCATCFGPKPQPKIIPKQQPKQQPNVSNRSPLALPFKGSCPNTHFKATDAMGDFCKPCPAGQIYNKGSKKCAPKPPACPCNLPRQGDPDFGKCTPPPPGCGPAPQAQKCNVPGYGPRNLVCRCGKWQCPTAKDLLIEKFKAQGKAIPKGVAGYGDVTNKKPMIFLGILAAIVVGIFLFSK